MKNVNHYPDEFKIRIVMEVLTGQITKEECRRRYGIRGKCTVLKWIRKFSHEEGHLPQMKKGTNEEIEDLRQSLVLLKKELEYERLKSKSYLEMIKIAEEDLKISIRKKFGAKQSRK